MVAGGDEPRLDIELVLEPVRAFADEGLLRVALTNLVDNARQASTAHGRVTVGVNEREIDGLPHACIEVRDTGSGMSADVLARACDPFFTTRPSGTGLGLAIVQRIVRAHGGKLEFESELGKGTRVRLVVPSEAPIAEQRA